MRRLLAVLVAAGAMSAVAVPTASADDVYSSHWKSYEWTWGEKTNCQSPFTLGSFGAYGANGYFVDGCTTRRATCQLASCWYQSITEILIEGGVQAPRTQNARTRIYSATGALLSHRDTSCASDGYARCGTLLSGTLYRGQSITVQCNGVHRWNVRASNKCTANLQI